MELLACILQAKWSLRTAIDIVQCLNEKEWSLLVRALQQYPAALEIAGRARCSLPRYRLAGSSINRVRTESELLVSIVLRSVFERTLCDISEVVTPTEWNQLMQRLIEIDTIDALSCLDRLESAAARVHSNRIILPRDVAPQFLKSTMSE